jgi:hypothetical protein
MFQFRINEITAEVQEEIGTFEKFGYLHLTHNIKFKKGEFIPVGQLQKHEIRVIGVKVSLYTFQKSSLNHDYRSASRSGLFASENKVLQESE